MAQSKKKKVNKNRALLFVFVFLVSLVFSVIGGYFFLLYAGEKMIDLQKLEDLKREASVLYDKDGNPLGELFIKENREYVPYNEIPKHVVNAFVAVEDKRFFEHNGIDIVRIGGAILADIQKGSLAEGGSTITQQLARNVFLSLEQTFWRKTKEAIIAINLERKFSKDEIMEMYLNQIYLGHGIFGIKEGAKYFFNKEDLSQLTLAEAATLAAIPKAPSYYSPFADPVKSKERRDTVLRLMMEQHYITPEQKEQAQQEPLPTRKGADEPGMKKGYRAYVDYVIREAEEVYGISEETLYRGGWKIYTALDQKMQDAMVDAYENRKNFPKDGKSRQVESGMVVVNPKTGGIAAMMGGRNYQPKGFNFAVDARRQPGSSFKPLVVYAPALDSGDWHVYSRLSNERQSFNGYEPRNYDNRYSKSVSMRTAVKDSINVPAVWLLNEIGVRTGIEYAKKFGITLSDEDRNLAIALGGLSKGTSPLKMAQAYSAFANGGKMIEAHAILKIEDERSGTVATAKPKETQVISPKAAWDMHTMLEAVVKEGTGKAARLGNRPVAGKTGSTQSGIYPKSNKYNKDVWFVGYTPEYVGAVWMGFSPEDPDHVMTEGSSKPAQLFREVFVEGLKGVKVSEFSPPAGVDIEKEPEETEETEIEAPSLVAVLAMENGQPKVVLSWVGNENNPELTYDVYRFVNSPDAREFVANVKGYAYVDPLTEPILYKYLVIPRDPNGMEGPASNVAEIDMSQLEQFIRDSQQHHQDGYEQDVPDGVQEDDGTDGNPSPEDRPPGEDSPSPDEFIPGGQENNGRNQPQPENDTNQPPTDGNGRNDQGNSPPPGIGLPVPSDGNNPLGGVPNRETGTGGH